jgi:hypothetical protein
MERRDDRTLNVGDDRKAHSRRDIHAVEGSSIPSPYAYQFWSAIGAIRLVAEPVQLRRHQAAIDLSGTETDCVGLCPMI